MCGHVGVFANKLSYKLSLFFEDLLNLDIPRGRDSTGVAFIKTDGKTYVSKDAVLPYELVRDKVYDTHIHATDNVCLLGHNRAATLGKVNAENAHPFDVGNIILAHNGTLTGQWRLPDFEKYDSDSHNIAHSINKIGIDETWKLIEGAAVLVFYDKKAKTINIIGNGERSFFYVMLKGGHGIAWCSDDDYLKLAMRWRGVEAAGKEGHQFHKLDNHTLYTAKVGRKGGLDFTYRKLEYTEYEKPKSYRGADGYWREGRLIPFERDEDERWSAFGSMLGDRSSSNRPPVVSSTVDLTAAVNQVTGKLNLDWKGDAPGRMSAGEFHTKYKNCVFCEKSLEHEYECAMIIDHKTAVCNDCRMTAEMNNIEIRV